MAEFCSGRKIGGAVKTRRTGASAPFIFATLLAAAVMSAFGARSALADIMLYLNDYDLTVMRVKPDGWDDIEDEHVHHGEEDEGRILWLFPEDMTADPADDVLTYVGTSTITITVQKAENEDDAPKDPAEGVSVFFAVTGGDTGAGGLSDPTGNGHWVTDANGDAVVHLNSSVVNTVEVTGYLGEDDTGDVLGTVDVTFIMCSLTITDIPGAVTAGESFNVVVELEGYDEAVDPIADIAFENFEVRSNVDGSVYEAHEAEFTDGAYTASIGSGEVTTAGPHIITVDADDVNSDTAVLAVNSAAAHHFKFDTVPSPQGAGRPFSITITAYDQYGNVADSYDGVAALSASSGTIAPDETGAFDELTSAWTGSVTIDEAGEDVTITAEDGTITGISNFFSVRYPLEMVASPEAGGTAEDVTGIGAYQEGAIVDIKATAKPGFEFVSWTSDGGMIADSGEPETTFEMPAAAATVTANFETDMDGSGTSVDPYIIRNWHHLNSVRYYLGSHFELGNDLHAGTAGYNTHASDTANDGQGFEPVGTDALRFNGDFDGAGYAIRDLFIDRSSDDVGLFGVVTTGGAVNNVILADADVTGGNNTGICIGRLIGNSPNISNIVTGGKVAGSNNVGGVFGYASGRTISDIASSATVSGAGQVGGIAGFINATCLRWSAEGNVSGTENVGGVIGQLEERVEQSYAAGDVTGGTNIGGLVGWLRGATVLNCNAHGTVSGSSRWGGLVGWQTGASSTEKSYSTGAVSAGGGLLGVHDGSGAIIDSFWDTVTSGTTDSAGGTGLTTAQMQNISTYQDAEWDIGFNVAEQRSYPYLANPSVWYLDRVADALEIVTQPGETVAGEFIEGPPAVRVLEDYGEEMPAPGIPVTAGVAGGFSSGAATVYTDSGGVAAFEDLVINTAGAYTLSFSSDGLTGVESEEFDVIAGDAYSVSVQTQPGDAVAGDDIPGVDADHPQALVVDAYGNPVEGEEVTAGYLKGGEFMVFDAGASSLPSALTDAGGVATFEGLRISAAGSYRLVFEIGGGLDNALSSEFKVTASVAAALSYVSGDGQSGVISTTLAAPFVVRVEDAYGNPVGGETVDFAVTSTPAGAAGQSMDPVSVVSGAGGTAGSTLTLGSRTGLYEVEASAAGASAAFTATATAAAATSLSIHIQPEGGASGGSLETQPVIHILDAEGNRVSGDDATKVTVAIVSGAGGTLGGSRTVTADGGVARFTNLTLAGVAGEEYVLGFTSDPALTPADSDPVTVTHGAATRLSIHVQPEGGPSGEELAEQPVIHILDAQGNLVTGDDATEVTAGIASGAGGSLGGSRTLTASGGVVEYTDLTLAGWVDEDYELRFSAAGLISAYSEMVNVTVGAPDAYVSTIQAHPVEGVIAGSESSELTITVRDAQGNVVADEAVFFAITAGDGELSDPPVGGHWVTDANGEAVADLTSSVAGTVTVAGYIGEDAGGALIGTADVGFVPGDADAGASTVLAAPTDDVTADGVEASTITVTLRDAEGAQLPRGGDGDDITLTTTLGEIETLTDRDDGTYTAPLRSTVSGLATVTARLSGALIGTADVTFVPGDADAGESTIVADPESGVTADGSDTSVITITVRDAQGNVVPDEAVFFAITAGDAGAGGLSAGPWTTDADGRATAELTSTVAAAVEVTGYIGVDDGGDEVGTAQVTFVTGPAYEFEVSVLDITAGGRAAIAITDAKDAHDNPLEGVYVADIDIVEVPGGESIYSASGVSLSFSGGEAAYTTGDLTRAGVYSADVTIDGAEGSDIFEIFSAAAYKVSVRTQPGDTQAGSAIVGAGGADHPEALVVDRFGNPVGGVDVMASYVGAGGFSADDAGVLDVSHIRQTDESGIAEFEALVITAAGDYSLVFHVDDVGSDTSKPFNIFAAPADAGTSEIDADPPYGVVADGADFSTITVTLRDEYGNPVVGGQVFLEATDTGAAGLDEDSLTTGAGGKASTSLTSTLDVTVTVTGYIGVDAGGALIGTADVTFVPGDADAEESTVEADLPVVTADGASVSTITVTLRDEDGKQLTWGGHPVTLQTDLGTLGPVLDAGDGTYTAELSSPETGTATVTARLGILEIGTVEVEFVPDAASGAASTIEADPLEVTADGTSASVITVTVRDAQGNVRTDGGDDVYLETNLGELDDVEHIGDGIYTATLTSTEAGTATVSASLVTTGGTDIGTAAVEFVPGEADSLSVHIEPAGGQSGESLAVQPVIHILDAHGNLVTGDSSTVVAAAIESEPAGGGTLGGAASVEADGGVVRFTNLKITGEAGVYTLRFSADGIGHVDSGDVTITHGKAAQLVIETQPAGGPSGTVLDPQPVVHILDAQGNIVTGDSSTVVSVEITSGAGGVLDGDKAAEAVEGVVTYEDLTLSGLVSESYVLRFHADGLTSAWSEDVTVEPGAADPGASTIEADPALGVIADNEDSSTITITVRDAQGNVRTAGGDDVDMSATSGTLSDVEHVGDGIYTATLKSTETGVITVTGTIDDAEVGTVDVAFVRGEADADESGIEADPTAGVTADGEAYSLVTVTLRDASGARLEEGGYPVTIETDLGALSALIDMGDGTYRSRLTSVEAGTATVTARVYNEVIGGEGNNVQVEFVPGAADAGASTIEADPLEVTADGTSESTVTITVRDAQGNVVAGEEVYFAITDGVGTLGMTGAWVSGADGRAKATLTSTTAGAVAVTGYIGEGVTEDIIGTAAVEFVPGEAASLSVHIEPAGGPSGESLAAQPVIHILDAEGNLAAGDSSTVVAAAIESGPAGALGGAASVEADGGVVRFTNLKITGEAGVYTLRFSAGGIGHVDSGPVTITHGAAAQLVIVTQPAGGASGEELDTQPVVHIFDAQGNLAGGDSSTWVSVEITSGAGGVLGGGAKSVQAYGGVVEYANLTLSGLVSEHYVLRFHADGLTSAWSDDVTVGPGAADPGASTIGADPALGVIADGDDSSTLTITVRDAQGNVRTAGGDDVGM